MLPTTMNAWRLHGLGGELAREAVPVPEIRPGSVLVRVGSSVLMSYLAAYVAGDLPSYAPPPGAFTLGTNGVGAVAAIGCDVHHLAVGQRVVVSSHVTARDNVEDPAQALIGLTAAPGGSGVLAAWPNGTLAEYALLPVEAVTPADGLDGVDDARLATVSRFVVPYGGLLRGRLAPGETLVVTGATGAYGTAAVLLGLALGAARVVAAGRDPLRLAALKAVAGSRLATVALGGEVAGDAAAIRAAAGGGAHLAFDMVGNAADPNATLAALHSLRRQGRLVLMGSMTAPLPLPYTAVMMNGWEILGQFMYPASAFRRLLDLVRSGQLDLGVLQPLPFPIADLPAAMAAAREADNLHYAVIQHRAS